MGRRGMEKEREEGGERVGSRECGKGRRVGRRASGKGWKAGRVRRRCSGKGERVEGR